MSMVDTKEKTPRSRIPRGFLFLLIEDFNYEPCP